MKLHKRATATVLAAGAALAAVLPANASTTRPVVTSGTDAGLVVAAPNVRYRFVAETLTLPVISNAIPFAEDGFAVQLANGYHPNELFNVAIRWDGNAWNAWVFNNGNLSGGGTPFISSGDTVRLSAYYDYATRMSSFAITDLTTGRSAAGGLGSSVATDYTSAHAGFQAGPGPSGTPGPGGDSPGPFTAPAAPFRLALLTGLAVTQRNGRHVGFGSSSQVQLVSGTGADEVDAPTLWNHATNLGIWVRSGAG